jgi:hypothetical protein
MAINTEQALQILRGGNRALSQTGVPSLDATPVGSPDPFRAEAPNNTYDLTVFNPANLLPDSAPSRAAQRIVDYNLGALGHVAYWVDRPYTAVMSFLDTLTMGKGPLEATGEAWKGFTGKREAGFVNILENMGFNPQSNATQWAGVAMDVGLGTFLDPVSWLTFGTSKALRGIKAGTEILGAGDTASTLARQMPRTFKQLNDAGITHVPGRVELAKAGLYGLNAKLPYWGKEGVVLTPQGFNVAAAKTMDRIGNFLEPVSDYVHQYWGGVRALAEKSGLADVYDWFNLQTSRRGREILAYRERMANVMEGIPVERRREILHSIENENLIDAQGTVRMVGAERLTPEAVLARNKEYRDFALTQAKTVEEFNRAVVKELDGLEVAMDSWEESAKRHRVVTMAELEPYYHDPMGNVAPGQALTEFMEQIHQDPRVAEGLINQMLREHYGLPEGVEARFKAIVGGKSYKRMSDQQVVTKQGAIRPPTEQEVIGRMQREAGEFLPENAAALGETDTARILVEVPKYSTLSDEFSNLGGPTGLADMRLKKQRVKGYTDALRANSLQGGNSLDLTSSYMDSISETLSEAEKKVARKRYLNEVNRMNKRAGDGVTLYRGYALSDDPLQKNLVRPTPLHEIVPSWPNSTPQSADFIFLSESKDVARAYADQALNTWDDVHRTKSDAAQIMDTLFGMKERPKPGRVEKNILAPRKTFDISDLGEKVYYGDVIERMLEVEGSPRPDWKKHKNRRDPIWKRYDELEVSLFAAKPIVNEDGVLPAFGIMRNVGPEDTSAHLFKEWLEKNGFDSVRFAEQGTKHWAIIGDKLPKWSGKIDPNSKSFTQIVEAIHARRIANEMVPGYYSANARRYSDELLAGEIIGDDPAARHLATMNAGRAQLDEVNRKIAEIDNGHMPAAMSVPPDFMGPEELQAMAERIPVREKLVTRRNELLEEIRDLNSEEARAYAREVSDADPFYYDARRKELLQDLGQAELGLGSHDYAPIQEVQNRMKKELVEERDFLIKQVTNPDPFDASMALRDHMKKKLRYPGKDKGYIETFEDVPGGGIDTTHWTPEVWEARQRVVEIGEEIKEVFEARFRKYDPDYVFPIENYVKHMLGVEHSIFAKAKKAKSASAYKKSRKQELLVQHPDARQSTIDRIIEDEIAERFGKVDVRLTKAEREGGLGSLKSRKYSKVEDRIEQMTILSMQRAGSPLKWEDDVMLTTNYSFSEAMKFQMQFDAVEELMRRNLAVQLKPGADLAQAQKLLRSNQIVRLDADNVGRVLGEKNPFSNLFVDKSVKEMYDRYLTGQVQNAVQNEAIQKFLDIMNAVRRVGSAWTLLPFPGYHFRNLFGDTLRATHEGLDINLLDAGVRRRYQLAWQLANPFDKKAAKKGLPPPLRNPADNPELGDLLTELKQLYPNHAESLTPQKFMEFLNANVLETNYRDIDRVVKAADATDAGYPWKKGLNWLHPKPESNPLMQKAGRAGSIIQNQSRAWLFMDRLEYFAKNGLLDLPDAMKQSAAIVRKSLFDYTDLLPIEQHVWKNINWFYTYMSRSIPYHLEKMLTEPGSFGKYYRAYNGAWNFYEEEFEPGDTREFLSEQMGIPVRKYTHVDEKTGESEERWRMWIPQGWIGAADVNEAASWIRSFATMTPGGEFDREGIMQALGMNINIPTKAILEQIFAVDMFTGQEIDARDYSDVFGVPVSHPVNKFFRNIRLFNEIDRLNPGGLWTIISRDVVHAVEDERAHRKEAGQVGRWVQFMTGARLFDAEPFEDTKSAIYDQLRDLRDTQSNARSALRKGNTKEFNENRQAAIDLVPQIQEKSEVLAYWQAVMADEERRKAVEQANK